MFEVDTPRKSLLQLINQLAGDGVRVAEAELAQAKSELDNVVRDCVIGIALGIAGIALLLVTVTTLAQSAAIALTPYLTNAAYSYLSVGLVLAIVTITLLIIANRYLMKKRKPIGLIFKWFADVKMASNDQP